MNWLQRLLGGGKSALPVPQGYDPAKFKNGSFVQVASREQLEDFLRTWKLHNKLQPEQLGYAGRIAKVKSSGMYHGGDVLYQLEDIPGVWHEHLLAPKDA
jgi:hypothetical protein